MIFKNFFLHTVAVAVLFSAIAPVHAYDPFSSPPKNMQGVVYPQNAFAGNDFPPPPPVDFFAANQLSSQKESYTGVLKTSSRTDLGETQNLFFYDFVTSEKTIALQTEKNIDEYLEKRMTITFETNNGIQNIQEIHVLDTSVLPVTPVINDFQNTVQQGQQQVQDISEDVHTVAATGPNRLIFAFAALLLVVLAWMHRRRILTLVTVKKDIS